MHSRYLVPAIAVPVVAFAGVAPAAAVSTTGGLDTSVPATGAATRATASATTSAGADTQAATSVTGKAPSAPARATSATASATSTAGAATRTARAVVDQPGTAADPATGTTDAARSTATATSESAARATRGATSAVARATHTAESTVGTATRLADTPPLGPAAGVTDAAGSTLAGATKVTDAASGLARSVTDAAKPVTAAPIPTARSAVTGITRTAREVVAATPISPATSTREVGTGVLGLGSTAATSVSETNGGRFFGAPATSPSPTSTPAGLSATPRGSVGATVTGPAALLNFSPVLAPGAWSPSMVAAAANGAAPASAVTAFGAARSNVWEPTPLDPVRIVDRDPKPGSTTQAANGARRASVLRELFFGWFGRFMAFTGANLLRVVAVAVGLMMWGTAMLSAGRRLSSR